MGNVLGCLFTCNMMFVKIAKNLDVVTWMFFFWLLDCSQRHTSNARGCCLDSTSGSSRLGHSQAAGLKSNVCADSWSASTLSCRQA
eukprot:1243410-Amphidinium_carterae.1